MDTNLEDRDDSSVCVLWLGGSLDNTLAVGTVSDGGTLCDNASRLATDPSDKAIGGGGAGTARLCAVKLSDRVDEEERHRSVQQLATASSCCGVTDLGKAPAVSGVAPREDTAGAAPLW